MGEGPETNGSEDPIDGKEANTTKQDAKELLETNDKQQTCSGKEATTAKQDAKELLEANEVEQAIGSKKGTMAEQDAKEWLEVNTLDEGIEVLKESGTGHLNEPNHSIDADDGDLLKKATHLSEAGLGSAEVLFELLKMHGGDVQRTVQALSF